MNSAAQRLGFPQPTVSALIRDLETELGKPLFDRQARGTVPTEQARTLYPHMQRILADVVAARMSITGELNQAVGALRVGLGPSVTRGILPAVLPAYLAEYVRVDVQIVEAFSGPLIDSMLAGDLDVCIVAVPPKDRRIAGRRVAVNPLVMVSAPSFGRTHLKACDLRLEQELKLVMPLSQISIREVVDTFIASGQIQVVRMVEIDSLSSILDFVMTSDWVTFTPVTTVCRELATERLVIQPVTNPSITSEFYMVHPARRPLSAAALAFVAMVEDAFHAVDDQWDELMATTRA